MKTLVALLGITFFSTFNFGQNTKNSIPDSLCFHNFGLPAYYEFHIKDSIANTMGFDYKFVAGCVLVQGQMEEIQEHNKAVKIRLNKLLGADWERKFNNIYQEVIREN